MFGDVILESHNVSCESELNACAAIWRSTHLVIVSPKQAASERGDPGRATAIPIQFPSRCSPGNSRLYPAFYGVKAEGRDWEKVRKCKVWSGQVKSRQGNAR